MTEFGASSSFSSFTFGWTYHVFLSFRGEDTRYGFTGNLYHALRERGIRTFIDDQAIRKGEEITPTLLNKIEESKTAIVVFSKDYASSTFCLTELAHILDCMKGHHGRFIWPVFYDVDPSDIRHQKGSYKLAFDQYERVKDEKIVKRWRLALTEAANMSGWHFDLRSKSYEYEIMEEIIKAVSKEISIGPLHIAQFPVGLESRVKEVCSLLNRQPHCDGAIMVGIFGLGGIGKTTIARALYNEIASNFKHICFLNNVKEKSIHDHQKRLLSETLREKDVELEDYKSGIPIIRDRLHSKKVLLILDDIDTLEQLKALAGEPNWFGSDSIIIITTRDKNLLKKHGVKRIYEAKELNDGEARELLILNAFKKEVDPKYKEVINRAVEYAGGLPLALEILGSNLGIGQTVKEWETALDLYEIIPDKTVQNILKGSYVSLMEPQREIFLDIACFYRGYRLGDATNILSASHGVDSESCIKVLIDKSLIKIGEYGYLDMHDLIQDMGREIVRQESPLEAGKRSRLWFDEDIRHVLEENTGTSKIQVMTMLPFHDEKVEWSGEALGSMKNLRVLNFCGLEFSQGPKSIPNSLRVLEWNWYPSSTLPDNFRPINLVILSLKFSHLKTLGKPCKNFYNLRQLDLSYCENLEEVCDISGAVNLEELDVCYCQKLTKIDDSIGHLAKLRVLNAKGCIRLDTFLVGGIKLVSLEILDLSGCCELHTFPEISETMEKIKTLDLSDTAIETLPKSIEKLVALEELKLENCRELSQLQILACCDLSESNFAVLPLLTSCSTRPLLRQNFYNLRRLDLSYSKNLEEVFDISGAANLEVLDVNCCQKLIKIDDSVGNLAKLRVLNAEGCSRLNTFIVGGIKLVSLEILNLKECSELHTFPEILVTMEKIYTLDLSHTAIKTLPESIVKLVALEALYLRNCREIRQLPNLACRNLTILELEGCKHLQEIRGIPPSIEVFSAWNCTSLTSHSIRPLLRHKFYNLHRLVLVGCENLEELPDISGVTNLKELYVSDCKKLTKVDDSIGHLTKLRKLEAIGCGNLETFIVGGIKLVSLEILSLSGCHKLHTFPEILKTMKKIKTLDLSYTAIRALPESIEKLVAIEALYLRNCRELHQIPNLACRHLKRLDLDGCKQLQEIREIPPNIEVFSARNCTSLTSHSTRPLLRQELHEIGNTKFILPGKEIPEWFHKHSTGGSVSFWVHKKFPPIALCAVLAGHPFIGGSVSFMMCINGTYIFESISFYLSQFETDHIFLVGPRHLNFERDILEEELNHVEVSLEGQISEPRVKCIGVYVYNYASCLEDILFENPIPQKRKPVEVVYKICRLYLESSSVYYDNSRDFGDNSEEDDKSENEITDPSPEVVSSIEKKEINLKVDAVDRSSFSTLLGPSSDTSLSYINQVTCENHELSSNCESLTSDSMKREYQFTGQKDQSTIIDKGYNERGSHYSKDLQQQQHLTSINEQTPESSEIVKEVKGKDIIVYEGNTIEKKGGNTLEVSPSFTRSSLVLMLRRSGEFLVWVSCLVIFLSLVSKIGGWAWWNFLTED